MRRDSARPISTALAFIFILAGPSLRAQSPTPQSTLSMGTQLVVLDVTVHDRAGHPIHGLKASSFVVRESNTPQSIQTFEEQTSALPPKLPPMPPLPPGIFTNYSPVPAGSALNILLLDNLNTITRDKAYVHAQLRKYINQADPNARIAIFGFNGHLSILQGFSSDPAILRAAIESKTSPSQSTQLGNPNGMAGEPQTLSDHRSSLGFSGQHMGQSVDELRTKLQQFESNLDTGEGSQRVVSTLGAFNLLARYLAGFPGRKNIIWFSGAFPVSLQLNPSAANPLDVVRGNAEDVRATTILLARARVAVYPVDAREVVNAAVFTSANGSVSSSREPDPNLPDDIEKFTLRENQTRASMYQIAEDTGGHAFLEGKPLAQTVALALEDGSNYYTLTYVPSNREVRGDYRSIHIDLQGPAAQHRPKLAYRRGYFAGRRQGNNAAVPSDPSGAAAPLTINYA
jgi:VWFA-related protein